jgi:hypothetical protein
MAHPTTHVVKAIYFDEGPPPVEPELTNPTRVSGEVRANIDTRMIDGYRQGVELTLQKHYDMGTVKIHSGEPNHVLRQNRFGMDVRHYEESHAFMDNEKFNPFRFIQKQEKFSYLYDDIFTLPFVIGDNDEVTTRNFDGVIEPLTIRDIVGFRSIESPFVAHNVKANIAGFDDPNLGACQIVQVDYFNFNSDIITYDDRGYFKYEFTYLKPFSDSQETSTGFADDELSLALRLMKPATENFIPENKRSFSAGWDYDGNIKIGTDSIAFGGMTY